MAVRRAVLFGGSGYVGRHLATALAEGGWRVRVASREAEKLPQALRERGIEGVPADILDEQSVQSALEGAEAVVNFVGISRGTPSLFQRVHVEAARRVAALAAQNDVAKLVHVSALGIAEDAPSEAGRSKARGEAAVVEAFSGAMLVRPSLVYGPGDHFFSRFSKMARVSPALPLIGGGQTRFQPIHIDDAVLALQALLEGREPEGRRLALVADEIFTFRQLIERMLAVEDRQRLIVSIPFDVAQVMARGMAFGRQPPLTLDEVNLLRTDKIADGLPTVRSLGIAARTLDEGLASALGVFAAS